VQEQRTYGCSSVPCSPSPSSAIIARSPSTYQLENDGWIIWSWNSMVPPAWDWLRCVLAPTRNPDCCASPSSTPTLSFSSIRTHGTMNPARLWLSWIRLGE
jgi:hypothetical protein